MRFALVLLAVCCSADTLTLRSGQVVDGTYLGGSSRTIKMAVGDAVQTYDVADVDSLQFTGGAPAAAVTAPPPAPEPAPAPTQDAQYAAPSGVLIPAGTSLTVRMIDAVDSERNSIGQTFQASMDEPVLIGGQTVIPRGADVVVKLIDDKQSGKLTGKTQLTLDLVSVNVNGRMVDVNTRTVTQASAGRGARTAKMAGGGAALGAIIGAIAGGGAGAAIGAGAGAAAGTGVQIATKGQRVHIPSETRLTFVLETDVQI